MTEDQSFELASSAIVTIGNLGSAACNAIGTISEAGFDAIGDIGKSAFGTLDSIITSYRDIKLKALDNQLKEIEFPHLEKMQTIQNEHEQQMFVEQNRHEEFVISEQRKVFEKLMETASTAYKNKLDFFMAQLNCLKELYIKENEALSNHISYLEDECAKVTDDANKYMILSNRLAKLEDKKSELYANYITSQGNLEDAIKYLEIDKSFDKQIGDSQKKLLDSLE